MDRCAMPERQPFRPASSYAPGGATTDAAIARLELELRAARADLLSIASLLVDDSAVEALAAAPIGTWSEIVGDLLP